MTKKNIDKMKVFLIADYESRVVQPESRLQLNWEGISKASERGQQEGLKASRKIIKEALDKFFDDKKF